MRIGIDARFYNESGVGRYLRNLILNLKALDKKNEYFILLLSKDYLQFNTSLNFRKVEANFAWYGFAEQFKMPQMLKKFQLDLVHFPHFNVPIFYQGKFVVTIHDLIHQHHAMSRTTSLNPFAFKIKQIGYKRVFKTAVSRSLKILVPSESVQNLLTREWNVNKGKILITPEAVDRNILMIANRMTKTESEKVMKKFKIQRPYLFYVGNAHPHKNLESLIGTFLILQKKYPKLLLVLSGYDHYFWRRLRSENKHQNINYTGFISDEQLVALYKRAQAFIMPSYEEGFGIPVLEAMACGCPVISSNRGSLPEVGGEGAVYFNPYDIKDMTDKIDRVLSSNKLREILAAKGKKRVKFFSWEKLAKQTLEVYEELQR